MVSKNSLLRHKNVRNKNPSLLWNLLVLTWTLKCELKYVLQYHIPTFSKRVLCNSVYLTDLDIHSLQRTTAADDHTKDFRVHSHKVFALIFYWILFLKMVQVNTVDLNDICILLCTNFCVSSHFWENWLSSNPVSCKISYIWSDRNKIKNSLTKFFVDLSIKFYPSEMKLMDRHGHPICAMNTHYIFDVMVSSKHTIMKFNHLIPPAQ